MLYGSPLNDFSTSARPSSIWPSRNNAMPKSRCADQRRLTSKLIERRPVFSPDGKWIYFVSWETGKATIWKIPVDGGNATQVVADASFNPRLSPDGKML